MRNEVNEAAVLYSYLFEVPSQSPHTLDLVQLAHGVDHRVLVIVIPEY